MPSFSTLSGLFSFVEKQIESTLQSEISQESKKMLKESMEDKVYSRPTTGIYERKNELLNSSDTEFESSGTTKILSVFNNTSNNFMPSGHPSWLNLDSNENEKIPFWLEFGNESSLYAYSGTGYFEFMTQRLKKELKPLMIKGLKKRGIDAR